MAADAWYFDAVRYVFENGVMNGMSRTTFSPDTNLTRAQMVQILYNLEGRPAVSGSGFADVAADEMRRTLLAVDLNTLTPLEAMNLLYELQKKARG